MQQHSVDELAIPSCLLRGIALVAGAESVLGVRQVIGSYQKACSLPVLRAVLWIEVRAAWVVPVAPVLTPSWFASFYDRARAACVAPTPAAHST